MRANNIAKPLFASHTNNVFTPSITFLSPSSLRHSMTHKQDDSQQAPHASSSEEHVADEQMTQLVRDLQEALHQEEWPTAHQLVDGLHIADLAYLFDILPQEQRLALLALLRDQLDPELFLYVQPDVAEFFIEHLGVQVAAQALQQLEPDEAVSVLEDLEDEDQQQILQALSADARSKLEEGLAYPEESVGRLMRRKMVLVPQYWTVGNTIDYLRKRDDLPDEFYNLFIVDPKNRPVGSVLLSRLVRSPREVRMDSLMQERLQRIPVEMDQEEAAHLFRRYALVAAPVVNGEGRMLGVLTIDDMVEVVDEEADEDLLRMGGVFERDFYASLGYTVRRRFPWLFINLLAAFASASIVRLFEGTISQMVALAALMPIIASLGGNSGTQAVTVAVRALATKELITVNSWRAIGKEALVGLINGCLFAMVTFGAVFLWLGQVHVALVFAVSVAITLTFSGLMGGAIPVVLQRLGADPAVSSGVFLTTFTDATAFFVFLGIATMLLM